ncbi:glycerol-3-phosphate 1-O-acyltransferase PlsY [Rhizomicrobium electricum]|jgi:glycerol-3-phosphate acyltransferase PlsY|uniref:Glycerol-3-phosphate acyltransferase n=1 Tax=Rhizomicrobium electricum TaxID=480070 RepID=A0ABP3P644_9PROT|nr:glycerol-3-phosphate 1-O-acyltransferase PlsY [Rhizomicrobium electricum]NIJ47545.1 glycerol-3-phosphate acyltransferase PlsY [Rhizomicrobium electricum]
MNGMAALTWTGAGLAMLIGYGLGSIPFGLLISLAAGLGDVRKIGSGNIGATNVLRTGKKWAAALTLLLDGGKGVAAVLIAGALFGPSGAMVAGLAAVFGHVLPVWLKFKGGKGVATYIGVLLGIYWPVGLLVIVTWLTMAFVLKYSSLSALTAAALAPAFMMAFGELTWAVFTLVLTIVIFITHHENIYRLWHGKEPRIGEKKH